MTRRAVTAARAGEQYNAMALQQIDLASARKVAVGVKRPEDVVVARDHVADFAAAGRCFVHLRLAFPC